MRDNGPITNREVEMQDGTLLVSRTDTGGRISFVNQAFTDISGFSEEELLGSPHNLVRHPHMPKEAFANLWATIKAGRPWEGLVKNRAKNGDHYWVRANVTPWTEDGRITGYVSIRSKPSRDDIAAAERIYEAIRTGKGAGYGLDDGQVVRTGAAARLSTVAAGITGRMIAAFVLLVCAMVAVSWISLAGMLDAGDALRGVYHDRTVPAAQLGEIQERLRSSVQQVALGVLEARSGAPASALEARAAAVAANGGQIAGVWERVMATAQTPEQAALTARLAGLRAALDAEGFAPALRLLRAADAAGAERHLKEKLIPLSDGVAAAAGELVALQLRVAGREVGEAEEEYRAHLIIAAVVNALGALGAVGFCLLLLATIRTPLRRMEAHLDAIALGNFAYVIENARVPEFTRVTALLRAMKAKLAYSVQESNEQRRRAEQDRTVALRSMAETVEREAGAAVSQVADRTGAMARDALGMAGSAERVSANAQSVAAAAEQAQANAQTVAAASEELAASIREITAQVAHSGAVTRQAVETGVRTQDTIRSLSEAVGRIGEVAGLIQSIASQTNLLALNATIEAARAGEAGKGFAVVAQEVKNLANQTARSTDEITRQIGEVQEATNSAVEAVGAIGSTIAEIDRITAAIAAAMEEQAAATQEITRSVVETTNAAQEVAVRIAEVSTEADLTGRQATHVGGASDDVAHAIERLRTVLVRVVRTSTSDADRRGDPRFAVEAPCAVALGGQEQGAVIGNLSRGGAMLRGVAAAAPGARGTLVLADAGVRLGFTVVQRDGEATHVRFDEKDRDQQAFAVAFERLTRGRLPTDVAGAAAETPERRRA
ncbi:methyl-accepting chemotaxis protein [Azospirillum sp. TSO22-1]|uniref:methyl-accepting chemotaxis protein n=1 Tax=Azospirillum sp. TSO22-1 TaxID=716789 RepID=UPI000D64141C|nr:methyl-accepting chemotaxis protein [Azospirillum sp. TSO22-1]